MAVKKEYYTIKEAATILSVHPNTIRNRIKDGTLEAGRIGWDWRISAKAIDNFIKADKWPKKK